MAEEKIPKVTSALEEANLMQVLVTSKEVQRSALHALGSAKAKDSRVALIAMTLRGGAKSFDKVLKMIDSMVALLGEEQASDDAKKAYCEKELDTAEDEKKALDIKLSDLEKAIDDTEESIATLAEEIKALLKGISDLDAQVKEATTAREDENALYKKTMQEDGAAKDILKMAKNRLAKFYAPKMYQPPAQEERSSMGRISEEMSLQQQEASPGPPPETWSAYAKKNEEHGGVIAMMDLLIADLDKEMTMMTTEEKDAQKEYEEFIADAGEKRAADSKSAEQKSGEKAELEAALIKLQQDAKDTTKEAYLKEVEIKDLHMECDWLISTFEVRKEARAGEVDSLKKAKAVLSGADYSLVQTSVRHSDTVVSGHVERAFGVGRSLLPRLAVPSAAGSAAPCRTAEALDDGASSDGACGRSEVIDVPSDAVLVLEKDAAGAPQGCVSALAVRVRLQGLRSGLGASAEPATSGAPK
ncbi:unnamed protein product, partial [Prorocentrum cordatum]